MHALQRATNCIPSPPLSTYLTSASTPGPKKLTYFWMRSGSTHILNGVALDWNTMVNPSSPFGSTV